MHECTRKQPHALTALQKGHRPLTAESGLDCKPKILSEFNGIDEWMGDLNKLTFSESLEAWRMTEGV